MKAKVEEKKPKSHVFACIISHQNTTVVISLKLISLNKLFLKPAFVFMLTLIS